MNNEPTVRIRIEGSTTNPFWMWQGARDDIPDKYKAVVAVLDATDRILFESGDSVVHIAKTHGVGEAFYGERYIDYYLGE